MKTCSGCGKEKPLGGFPRVGARCQVCINAAARERYHRNHEHNRALKREASRRWHRANPEASSAKSRRWEAKNRERVRESRQRWLEANPEYFRDWYQRNIEKERERCRENMRLDRLNHPERERTRKRRYREANLATVRARERENTQRRRALKGSCSPELAALMARLVELPCAYCGTTENITIDHIVPLSRGGRHEADNLAPACFSCNASKCALLLEEWQPTLRRVS